MSNIKTKHIFFHVPRCGGTSVRNQLINQYGREKTYIVESGFGLSGTPNTFLSTKSLIVGHSTRDSVSLYPNRVLFTLLRNPYQRILSMYSYFRRIEGYALPSYVLDAKQLDFHDWLDSDNPDLHVAIMNSLVRQFVPDSFFKYGETAPHQNILSSAYNFLDEFCVVGFLEFIDVFVLNMNHVLGVNLNSNICDNSSSSSDIVYSKHLFEDWMLKYCLLDLLFIDYAITHFVRNATSEMLHLAFSSLGRIRCI